MAAAQAWLQEVQRKDWKQRHKGTGPSAAEAACPWVQWLWDHLPSHVSSAQSHSVATVLHGRWLYHLTGGKTEAQGPVSKPLLVDGQ